MKEAENQSGKNEKHPAYRLMKIAFLGLVLSALISLAYSDFYGMRIKPASHTAEVACYNLRNALETYFIEYDMYPFVNDHADVTSTSDHPLISILVGSENKTAIERNPRKISFYSFRPAVSHGGKHYKGVEVTDDDCYHLWDPWGNLYRVRLNSNDDNQVLNPENPDKFIPESVIVWSAGPDGNFSTWNDNVKTW